MKKVFMISMITLMAIALIAGLTGCTSVEVSSPATAPSNAEETSSSIRIYGMPYHVCVDTTDFRTYEIESTPVDQIHGMIGTIGNNMVSVTLDIDDTTEYILKNEAAITDGYVGITMVTSDRLVTGEGEPKAALSGAYDEIVMQLRERDIPGTVCVTLFEVNEESMDYIRVTRGW